MSLLPISRAMFSEPSTKKKSFVVIFSNSATVLSSL